MASTAAPLLFPTVRIGDALYGDGSCRLAGPPARSLPLGATDVRVISTRRARSKKDASLASIRSYPPTAQIIGDLLNGIFLDTLDQDARILRNTSRLVKNVPTLLCQGFRPVNCPVLRPFEDLGGAASGYGTLARGVMLILTLALRVSETENSHLASVLLFESNYIDRMSKLGWEDARRQRTSTETFVGKVARSVV